MRYFQIHYDFVKHGYILKVLEDKTGVFVKITRRHILNNNEGITFGNIEFIVLFSSITNDDQS